MGFRIYAIEFDELTADPGSPVEGQIWYHTTEKKLKLYRNGVTDTLVDNVTFTAHSNSTANPHTTTLEQARTAGNQLSGDVDLNGNDLLNVGAVGAGNNAASQAWTTEQINNKLKGLDWQNSVLDKDLATPPGVPSLGDRYIVAAVATGDWTGKEDQIAEWDGSAWVFTVPNEGFACKIEDENIYYFYNGSSWGSFGNAVQHSALIGLGNDDHAQYLLVSGARAMTGDLNMGGNSVSNVNLVDGVDVSAHAGRHERAGADEIDGDHLDIDYTPTNYTPDTTPPEAANVDDLAAHLAGIDNALAAQALDQKAGRIAGGTFAGNPKKATVTFSTAFGDADYAVVLTAVAQNNKTFAPAVESQVAGSFVVNMGSNNVTDLLYLNWIAMKSGESS